MLQTYGITGTLRLIDSQARYFKFERARVSPGESEEIRVRADGQDLGTYLPGDSIELPVNAVKWEITPASTSMVGVVRLGVGGVQSSRIVGSVEVIDTAADKSMMGRTFLQSNADGASATKVTSVCCNASGANVAIKRLYIGSATSGDILMGYSADVGTANPNASTMANKRAGGPQSVCKLGAATVMGSATPTAGQVPGYQQFARIYIAANQTLVLTPMEPFIITGTSGLLVQGAVVNRDLSVAFEVEEFD